MSARRSHAGKRRRAAGLTLVEVLISIAILALIGTLIYGAFDGMSRTRKGIGEMSDRYHQGRQALSRISRELQSAFISRHMPVQQIYLVRKTIFAGEKSTPTDRLDFTSFAHRRLMADAHESDQCEISYFAVRDPDQRGKIDLVRREAKIIDLDPQHGGVVNVLAEDIDSFTLRYLDPISDDWVDTWDTTQATGQLDRLPRQVWVKLVLRGGPGGQLLKFETKVSIPILVPLGWADQNPNTSSLSQSGGMQAGNDRMSSANAAMQRSTGTPGNTPTTGNNQRGGTPGGGSPLGGGSPFGGGQIPGMRR
ncbi:type II secretion system protein GspJ [Chondromyces crocatus]|uniref:Type II secretion system protein J n=1 Tax=Chondromyces crocatus TaxID=52 RepID=A0A0K1E757_CHOCO|nr:type II secretion system protein GspJ [Chondromyces crocatus]AKT36711.1 uncharacterized protein CMC5_008320 [Chondromyces crocatus]